jgi:glycosyltransferase involved in cell wall biosynthesis
MSALASPFVWREALRAPGRRPRVGWVLPKLWGYREADASTRLRAYDLWEPLRRLGVGAELYRPFFRYDAVVFQKAFEADHRELAARLRARGTRVVLDINVDYLHEDPEFVPARKREAMRLMLPLVDLVVASSARLARVYEAAGRPTRVAEDSVPLSRFPSPKRHEARGGVTFLYCGYAVKARELEPLRPVLTRLARRPGTRFLFVADKDPRLGLPGSVFRRFDVDALPSLLAGADVKLAPRDLGRAYNLGHSSAKIALPMAAGLAVAASPVPSYEGSPARLCGTESEWESCLEELADDPALRQRLGEAGRAYVRERFDTPVVAERYAAALREALS